MDFRHVDLDMIFPVAHSMDINRDYNLRISMSKNKVTQKLDRVLAEKIPNGNYQIKDFLSQNKVENGAFVERRVYRTFLMRANKELLLNVVGGFETQQGYKSLRAFCNGNIDAFTKWCEAQDIEVVTR